MFFYSEHLTRFVFIKRSWCKTVQSHWPVCLTNLNNVEKIWISLQIKIYIYYKNTLRTCNTSEWPCCYFFLLDNEALAKKLVLMIQRSTCNTSDISCTLSLSIELFIPGKNQSVSRLLISTKFWKFLDSIFLFFLNKFQAKERAPPECLASPAYEPLQTNFLLASIQTNSRTMRTKKLCIPFPDCVQTVHQRNAVLVTFWEPLLVEVGSTFGRPSGCSKFFVLDGSQNSTSQKGQKFILWILSGSHCPRLSPDSLQNGHSQIRTSGSSATLPLSVS